MEDKRYPVSEFLERFLITLGSFSLVFIILSLIYQLVKPPIPFMVAVPFMSSKEEKEDKPEETVKDGRTGDAPQV